MKKVCLIIRSGFDANYIVSELEKDNTQFNIGVIIETGGSARKKKLRRMMRKRNVFSVCINLAALILYDRIMTGRMSAKCGGRKIPNDMILTNIDDVNDPECIETIASFAPDVIIVYGTGIIKRDTIEKSCCEIYNVHSSILPYYRNVHSDFWAYFEEKRDLIGISLIKLDEGIDTGDIVMQLRCNLSKEARLHEYKTQNLINVPILIMKFLKRYFTGEIQHIKQDDESGTISCTPSTRDIIRFFVRELKG